MSLFMTQTVACPGCARQIDFDVNFSVNADRRPDLRAAILDGTFQAHACASCGRVFRLEPEISYVDFARGQWLLVRPAPLRARWPRLEQDALDTFETAYGAHASRDARALGAGLASRGVFGWAALREKIVCHQAGLDDLSLELTKLALVRQLPDTPFNPDTELRLGAVEGDELALAWIRFADESLVESLRVPRALYDDIAAAPQQWRALRDRFAGARYVDMARLLLDAEPA